MECSRRRALEVAGASISSAFVAGCLAGDDPGAGGGKENGNGSGSGDGNGSESRDGNGNGSGDRTGNGTGTGNETGTENETGTGNGGDDFQRVDDPPYEIDEPECDPPDGDRDPLWLCENMAAEPSLSFDQEETTGVVLRDEGLGMDHGESDLQFYATLFRDADDPDRVASEAGGAAVDLITEADYDTEAVLVAQTGWGSGSVTPHVKRIEETDGGIRAFGCYRRPCVKTDDYTARTVVARFERPDVSEAGVVSLTLDPETRVNFAVGEGVVTVEDET